MVPLGDEAQVEARFSPLEKVLIIRPSARFAPNVPSAQKSFWTHPIMLLGDEAQVKAHFGPFGDSANLDAR